MKKKHKDAASEHSIVFHCYPKLLFAWPLIVIGPLFWLIAAPGEDPTAISGRLEVLGWLYLLTMTLVVMTVGIDLERNYTVFWLVVFLLFFFLGRWLIDVQHFTLFGEVYRWFANRDVQYDRNFALVLSIFLAVPYARKVVQYGNAEFFLKFIHDFHGNFPC